MAPPHVRGEHFSEPRSGALQEGESDSRFAAESQPVPGQSAVYPSALPAEMSQGGPAPYGQHAAQPDQLGAQPWGAEAFPAQAPTGSGEHGGSPEQPFVSGSPHGQDAEFEDEEPDEPLVRPYAMTGGRTRPRYQLAIEALVSTTTQASQATGLLPEHQRIVELCQKVESVAEISALLGTPLGVARILVADLAEAGLVAIHQPGNADEAGQPDVTLLERVLSGLRKL